MTTESVALARFRDASARPSTPSPAPNIRLMPRSNMAGGGYVPMMRAAATLRGFCLPDVYLDGIPQPGADELDDIIMPFDIEGIEVYRSASEVPARYTTAGANCGVILLWSRKGG